jgi:hypothetical protein
MAFPMTVNFTVPNSVIYEVVTALKTLILAFWVVMPYGLVSRDQRFGGTYCHNHLGRRGR